MTRTAHHPHPTPSFPVYCLDWADDDTLLLGGGGGASRSGIQNKLKVAKVSKDGRDVKYKSEVLLSNEEDAPMTIAVDTAGKQLITGINASSSSVQEGSNDHCRVYSFSDTSVELVKGQKTITAEWSDDYPYQKLTALSPSADLLAVGTTDDKVSLLHYPSLETAIPTFSTDSELVDLDWGGPNGSWLAVTTAKTLLLYRVGSEKKSELELKQTIYTPSLDIVPAAFRSARFSRNASSTLTIHAVLNATKSAKRGAPRKAFVVTFGIVSGPSKAALTEEEKKTDEKQAKEGVPERSEKADSEEDVGKWDVVARREVGGKPVTVFDASADGKLLAYGCSDLSIGILDSKTLAPLLKILHAHSFPPTALKFNPSASLLVSASADNTIRAIVVPASFGGVSATVIALLLAILVLILALVLRSR
ncbi:prolactin regulatory element-binding protein [Kwoniella heveanensis CBS 569]|nr:prolactin regulatory element-binding protein [Kwoniella heveanensis CBS 569]